MITGLEFLVIKIGLDKIILGPSSSYVKREYTNSKVTTIYFIFF